MNYMRFIIYTLQLYLHIKNAFKVKVKINYLLTYNAFYYHYLFVALQNLAYRRYSFNFFYQKFN